MNAEKANKVALAARFKRCDEAISLAAKAGSFTADLQSVLVGIDLEEHVAYLVKLGYTVDYDEEGAEEGDPIDLTISWLSV